MQGSPQGVKGRGPKLTDLAMRALQPRAERYVEWFADGLGVRVSPAGAKTFIYWYSFEGRKRLMTLGPYPSMPVRDAIAAHATARASAQRGVDPAAKAATDKAERKAAHAAAQAIAARPTLRETFERWRAAELQPRVDTDGARLGRRDGGAVLLAQFDRHVFPTLGDVVLDDVSRGAILEVLDRVKNSGKRRTASVLFSALKQMLDWCEARELVARNPMAVLRRAKTVGRHAVRTRALVDWEIRRLLHRLPLVDLHAVTVLALRFVLATGQRPGEVAGMRKDDLDAAGTLWTIPASRYKTGIAQRVPLSKHARALVAQAAAYNFGSDFVFPSPRTALRCIDRHSLSRAVDRKLGDATPEADTVADGTLGLAPFTPHDLRRTCRTGLARIGVAEHVAEQVIGHRLQGMLAVYNQHEYLNERRAGLDAWGDHLDALERPAMPARSKRR